MKFAKFARAAAVAGLVIVAVWGQSQAAQAQEIIVEDRDETAVMHGVTVLAWARVDGVSPAGEGGGAATMIADPAETEEASPTCCDDVIVDGRIITAEDAGVQTSASDPEWKYVPVRRTVAADTDAAGDGDHEISHDAADDLLPLPQPASAAEATAGFDGRPLSQ